MNRTQIRIFQKVLKQYVFQNSTGKNAKSLASANSSGSNQTYIFWRTLIVIFASSGTHNT